MSINLGHYSGGGTPVLIPNTEVKSSSAYGTSGLPWWESRSWPSLIHIYQSFFIPFHFLISCNLLVSFVNSIAAMNILFSLA